MAGGMLQAWDELATVMEDIRIIKRHWNTIKGISKNFSPYELQVLLLIYYKILKQTKTKKKFDHVGIGIPRSVIADTLSSALNMANTCMVDRLLEVIIIPSGSNYCNPQSWIILMDVLLQSTLDEKILLCFKIYDLYNEGYLRKYNFFYFLRHSIISSGWDDDAEEAAKDLTQILFTIADTEREGRISFQRYKAIVEKNPLYLEMLGPCFPDRVDIYTFISATFTKSIKM